MKTSCLVLVLLGLAVGCRTAPTESLQQEREQIRLAIEMREEQLDEAIRTRDAELLVRLYGHDARVILPGEGILNKSDLLPWYEAYLTLNPSQNTKLEHLDVAPGIALTPCPHLLPNRG